MTKRSTLGLVAAAMMLATISPSALATSEPETETPIPVDIIEGLDWSLQRQAVDGVLVELPRGVVVTLSMVDGTATGNGGCNEYFTAYERDGDALTFGAIGATEMYCPDTTDIETSYFANLEDVARGFSTGGSLVMTGADGNPILAFVPADVGPLAADGIEGLVWQLDTIALPDADRIVLVPPEIVATITLLDGAASGNGGCNSYASDYALDGAALAFGPIASTRKGCPDPIAQLEDALFTGLAAVSSWYSDGGSLTLLDADGAEIARFRLVTLG